MKNNQSIKIANLFDICNPKQWKTVSTKDLTESGYPLYGANGKIGFYSIYNHEYPTLLVTCRGATCGSLIISEPKSYINGNAMALDNLSVDVDIKYLYYYLSQRGFNDSISGSAQPQITRQGLQKIKIPLPSLKDQKRIVEILDQADTVRQKRKQVIEFLDDFLKSRFFEMFGKAFRGYDSWRFAKLKDLVKKTKGSMRSGPFGSDLLHSEFVNSGIAVIGIDNAVQNKFAWDQRRFITQEKYEKLKRYTLFPRDVVITIMGTIGKTAVIPEDIPLAINTKHLAAITLDEHLANPYFISYSIHSDPLVVNQISHKGRGAIMTGLNLGIIKDLQLKVPPIEKQNEFESILHKTESLNQKMLFQSEELENQFQALMQKAFSGNL